MSIRIISGAAKGRMLKVPDTGTRPTSERMREALFNTLGDIEGLRVLDLYAGSGAIGLEALSRGASEVVFVENDRKAGETLRRNLDSLRLAGGSLSQRTVAAMTATTAPAGFDIVFLDPPYSLDDDDLATVLQQLAHNGWLAAGADVIVERASRGAEPRWPDGVRKIKDRRYGEGTLWYGRARDADDAS